MLKVRFGVINDPEGSFQLRTPHGAVSSAVPSLGELTSLLHLTSHADLSHLFPHPPRQRSAQDSGKPPAAAAMYSRGRRAWG